MPILRFLARYMLSHVRLSDGCIIEQESCAIAKTTARCSLYK